MTGWIPAFVLLLTFIGMIVVACQILAKFGRWLKENL